MVVSVTLALCVLATGREAILDLIRHDFDGAILPALIFGIAVMSTGWILKHIRRS
jgi:hypothetical protein